MLHLGMTEMTDREIRGAVEEAFGIEQQRVQGNDAVASTAVHQRLLLIDNVAVAISLYAELGDLRNDLLHAGKRASARPSKTLARAVPKLCGQIDDLELPHRLDGA